MVIGKENLLQDVRTQSVMIYGAPTPTKGLMGGSCLGLSGAHYKFGTLLDYRQHHCHRQWG